MAGDLHSSPSVSDFPPAGALPRPILLLINGNSRRGRDAFEEVQRLLKEAGVPLKEAVLAKDKKHTQSLLKREIEEGAKTVIIGGGDGTLSHCAGCLANSPVAMAVLPLGTGNTFVRSLGLPVDLAAAVKTIAGGHVEAVDVGEVNGRIFLNSVSLGLSAMIAGSLTHDIKKKLGVFSWPVMGLKVLMLHRPLRLTLAANGETKAVRTHQLLIANGRYVAGPLKAAPDASLQNSHLEVFTLGGPDKRELAATALRWLVNRHVGARGVRFIETQELEVRSRRKVKADVDGDLSEETPLTVKILPRALRVVVPEDFVADAV